MRPKNDPSFTFYFISLLKKVRLRFLIDCVLTDLASCIASILKERAAEAEENWQVFFQLRKTSLFDSTHFPQILSQLVFISILVINLGEFTTASRL